MGLPALCKAFPPWNTAWFRVLLLAQACLQKQHKIFWKKMSTKNPSLGQNSKYESLFNVEQGMAGEGIMTKIWKPCIKEKQRTLPAGKEGRSQTQHKSWGRVCGKSWCHPSTWLKLEHASKATATAQSHTSGNRAWAHDPELGGWYPWSLWGARTQNRMGNATSMDTPFNCALQWRPQGRQETPPS